MQTTTLGRTGLTVSRIAFGTWQLGGDWGTVDGSAAIEAIRHALSLGCTLFDTAQGYGDGAAEELLGRALRPELDRNRDSVVIATKGGINPGTDRPRDAGRAFLRAGVESSLRALGVDHIDLYQVHWPDPDTPAEETAGVLAELVAEGKIRHVGVSNYDAGQLAAFDRTLPVETLQPPYHLFRRGIEKETLPYARANDIGVLVYSPLGSGLLTGALRPDSTFGPGDWRSSSSAFSGEMLRANLAVVDKLAAFAERKGITVAQLAIAWTLAKTGVHAAIVGARGPRHVEASMAAADLTLSAGDVEQVEAIAAEGISVEGATPEGVD